MASSHPDVSRPGRRRQSPGLSLAAVALVTFATLRVADRIPGWVAGVPSDVRTYGSLADAERAAGRRLGLPFYFPNTLRWPPAAIRSTSPATSVAVVFDGLDGRPARLVVCETGEARGGCAPPLVEEVTLMERRPVNLAGRPAELRRVLDPSGRQVTEIAWASGNRRRLLRFEGPVDQALLMAQSIERSRR